jgi:hypothetical protein
MLPPDILSVVLDFDNPHSGVWIGAVLLRTSRSMRNVVIRVAARTAACRFAVTRALHRAATIPSWAAPDHVLAAMEQKVFLTDGVLTIHPCTASSILC